MFRYAQLFAVLSLFVVVGCAPSTQTGQGITSTTTLADLFVLVATQLDGQLLDCNDVRGYDHYDEVFEQAYCAVIDDTDDALNLTIVDRQMSSWGFVRYTDWSIAKETRQLGSFISYYTSFSPRGASISDGRSTFVALHSYTDEGISVVSAVCHSEYDCF